MTGCALRCERTQPEGSDGMKFFDPNNQTLSSRHRNIYAVYQVAHTAVDFTAAVLFLVGSVMFLYPSVEIPATWCFIIGSAFFMMKPTIRIVRELHFLAIGDITDLERVANR
jgi:hypothetical protein